MSPEHLVNFETMERFARNTLGEDKFPDGHVYQFSLCECSKCGGPTPMIVTIEHHKSSADFDFRGRILLQCGACDESNDGLSFTDRDAERQTVLRRDTPRCECGNPVFAVATCLNFEPGGFLDDGAVIGQCPQCGKCRVFVKVD